MRFSSPVQDLGSGSRHEPVYSEIAEAGTPEQSSATKSEELTQIPANSETFLSQVLSRPKVTGAAIAVAVGDHLECIWSHGSSAPPSGSCCYPGVGLTGWGFSAGKLQLCNDTRHDSRVDQEACLNLDVKSLLVVPLKNGTVIVGVLEVLSSVPNAFDWRAIRFITRLAKELDVSLAARSSSLTTGSPEKSADSSTHQSRDFDLQEVLHAAWVVQQNGAFLDVDKEDANIANEESVGADQCRSKTPELARFEVVPSPSSNDAPFFESLNDDFTSAGGHGKYIAVAVSLAILLVCFFLFRMQAAPLNAVFQTIPQAPKVQESTRRQKITHEAVQKPAPHSYASAMTQFEDEARNGDADASWKLGLGYLRGIGVPKDEIKATEWLKKAANLDDARAQVTLSDCYLRGLGVQRDYVRAYTWASIAARQTGDRDDRLTSLRQLMTQPQLNDANRRVNVWFAHKSVRY